MRIDKELYEKIQNITITDYEPVHLSNREEYVLIFNENVLSMIEDLVDSYETLKLSFEEYKQDIEENYQRKRDDDYDI